MHRNDDGVSKDPQQDGPDAAELERVDPLVRAGLRFRFGRKGFREARFLANQSGRIAAFGPGGARREKAA